MSELHEGGTSDQRPAAGAPPKKPQAEKNAEPEKKPPPSPAETRKKRIRIALIAGAVAVVALLWWLHARRYEDTDDAQVDGYITAVSPRVQGTVTKVLVEDNQVVKAGDVLVELDTADLEVAHAQARAAVALAEAQLQAEQPSVSITQTANAAESASGEDQVTTAEAELEAFQRELEQAQANARLAHTQLERARQLLESKTIPQAEFDTRSTAAEAADAAVAAAKKRVEQRRTRVQTAQTRVREVRTNGPRQVQAREATLKVRQANLELARAQLHQAELNLGYARITAPVAGIVGKRTVNLGDRVQPGQQLFSITQTGEVWVTANFRETQLENMQAGQEAEIHIDAVSRDYRGKIESFAGATGSRYSLLPPENASGNYVKVVQRVPVRMRLEPGQPDLDKLRPGMSAEPKVKVR